MDFRAATLADSVGPHSIRLTSFEVTFPQMVLRDKTRHRILSYSFESTRAVPTELRIEQVKKDPYIPIFMKRAKGMGGGEPLSPLQQKAARTWWKLSARSAAFTAERLLFTGKEHVGRILEPYGWITGIISGTEWENFFGLRCPPVGMKPNPKYPAQYELQVIADKMRTLYREGAPRSIAYGDWHLPLVTEAENRRYGDIMSAKASAGRCARTSYLKQNTYESIPDSASRWVNKLAPHAHWSPGEHPAECVSNLTSLDLGNYTGFRQLRKFYPGEAIHSG